MNDMKKEIFKINLSHKYVFWPIIISVIFCLYGLILLITEIIYMNNYLNFLIFAFFITLTISFMFQMVFQCIYCVSNKFILNYTNRLIRRIKYSMDSTLFCTIFCAILSIIFLNAWLGLNLDLHYLMIRNFFICLLVILIFPTFNYILLMIDSRIKKKRKIYTPLIFNTFSEWVNFLFFFLKTNKNKEKCNLYKAFIVKPENFSLKDQQMLEILNFYENKPMKKMHDIFIKSFSPLNVFLWSSLVTLFAIIIDWSVLNRDKPYLADIVTLIVILIVFLILLSLYTSNFVNTNKFQLLKEDNDIFLKDKIEEIIVKCTDASIVLNDVNLNFLVGMVNKILLYQGKTSNLYIFSLTGSKNIGIFKNKKELKLDINLKDNKLIVNVNSD